MQVEKGTYLMVPGNVLHRQVTPWTRPTPRHALDLLRQADTVNKGGRLCNKKDRLTHLAEVRLSAVDEGDVVCHLIHVPALD